MNLGKADTMLGNNSNSKNNTSLLQDPLVSSLPVCFMDIQDENSEKLKT